MKVAITGASGYVGSRLSRGFAERGDQILSLSRKKCAGEWSPFSLADDPASLPLDGVDVLIHAAYDFSASNWEEIAEVNIAAGKRLFEAARSRDVSRLVLISSLSSFSGCQSKYGRAKLALEEALADLGAIIIRPGLVWGPEPGGVMGSLDRIVRALPIVPVLSGKDGLPQYLIHEDDLAAAIFSITRDAEEGTIHSLAYPQPYSLRDILSAIAARRGAKRIFVPVPWQVAMAGLRGGENLGLTLPFRSDSLVGLVHSNPSLPETLVSSHNFRKFA